MILPRVAQAYRGQMQIAIIGKPNVGKSSLFNKLCGKKLAIVDDTPGITRDRKKYKAQLHDLDFMLIDTAGWEYNDSILKRKMNAQSEAAIFEADVILFMVDGRNGITQDDLDLANLIRRTSKPVLLLVNKSEGRLGIDRGDLARMGLGEPIYIAVHTRQGFEDLHPALLEMKKQLPVSPQILQEDKSIIRLALIGRPNVGKSMTLNKILGMERVITSEISGTTRDTTSHPLEWKDQKLELIDTAGMRKRKNIDCRIEDMSIGESINAIRRAHIVVLVVEATEMLLAQDLAIAKVAVNEGKAFVLVVNKCDLVTDKRALRQEIEYQLHNHLREVTGVPVLYISALKEETLTTILDQACQAYQRWSSKINTGALNRWLRDATDSHIPPLAHNGRRIRLKYMVQNGAKPPTFTIFSNIPENLPDSYTRYLINSLRQQFELEGIPIRLNYRKNENPYEQKATK